MNVDLPPMNNMLVLPEPREETNSNTKIDHGPIVSGRAHNYILIRE